MKKLISAVLTLALVLSLSVSVAAFEGSAEISVFIAENVTWETTAGESVVVDAPGEYTVTLTGLEIDAATMTVLYIKDAAVNAELATTTNLPSDIEVVTKSLKINGEEIALTEGYMTGLNENGIFDICYYNIWSSSFFDAADLGIITDVEVVFEVISTEGAEDVSEEDIPDEEAPVEETPVTETEEPADTGLAFAVIPMIVAAAAVAVSKKK